MFRLSIAKSKSNFEPVEIADMDSLAEFITKNDYSCGIFKDNYRNSDNFIYATTLALDFDGGLSIKDVELKLKGEQYIIAPSRNHRKVKNGLVSDRYRVVLPLDKAIDTREVYEATYRALLERFPQADKACSDAARMFYKSQYVYKISKNGRPVTRAIPTATSPLSSREVKELDFNKKPSGWSNCCWAIANGEFDKGEGNSAMMSLCTMLFKLNYSKSQAYYICKDALQNRHGDYDKKGLWREVIEVVYGPHWKGTKYVCFQEGTWLNSFCKELGSHACEHDEEPLHFQSIGDLMASSEVIDWLVDGLLTVGGVSIMVASPKAGKSTLSRQLALAVARGTSFLDRKATQGHVLYLALEEQGQVLTAQLKRMGATSADDIQLHIGPPRSRKGFGQLETYAMEKRPSLIVVDTMMLFANFKDINSYKEVNDELALFRKLARDSGAHVMFIHHQNKGENRGTTSILGSSAIHGAVDCAIILNSQGKKRIINTSQRCGKPFIGQGIVFDPETETYKMGVTDELKF